MYSQLQRYSLGKIKQMDGTTDKVICYIPTKLRLQGGQIRFETDKLQKLFFSISSHQIQSCIPFQKHVNYLNWKQKVPEMQQMMS